MIRWYVPTFSLVRTNVCVGTCLRIPYSRAYVLVGFVWAKRKKRRHDSHRVRLFPQKEQLIVFKCLSPSLERKTENKVCFVHGGRYCGLHEDGQ